MTLHPLAEGLPEPWAMEWGEDRFGPFMSFAVGEVVQRMRWVPPGNFLMGSPNGELGRFDSEGPQHAVELRRGFWLTDTSCTWALWLAVMGAASGLSEHGPVSCASWSDCQRFLARLNTLLPELDARLPTEAEWEYACRGGTTGATEVGELDLRGGNDMLDLDVVARYGFAAESGMGKRGCPNISARTRPVGCEPPNPLGLFDMLGNWSEWCSDWYGPYDAAPATDPRGPDTGSDRVVRGFPGSRVVGRYVRASDRIAVDPTDPTFTFAFRLARSQGPGPAAAPPAVGERSRQP